MSYTNSSRYIKFFSVLKNFIHCPLFLLTVALGGVSCQPTELSPKNNRSQSILGDGTTKDKALVYEDSPYILGGPNFGPKVTTMAPFLSRGPQFITNNPTLTGNCLFDSLEGAVEIEECIHSRSKESSTETLLARRADGSYMYPTDSGEFYQVNTLYHLMKSSQNFFTKLSFTYQLSQDLALSGIPTSIPADLPEKQSFWFAPLTGIDQKLFKNNFLTSYAQCNLEKNASFSPVGPTLCFGSIKSFPGFYFVQDPSIIYHEMGHAIISLLMNLRNESTPLKSNLGNLGYDEAGALGEGISDYFSYLMNKRERMGEFALGRTFNQARPLSEGDSLHTLSLIEENAEGRLSYPQYLHYDPNYPTKVSESVHYAGQIVSHYLVALTKALKKDCGEAEEEWATSMVFTNLAETFSELGDLTAKAVNRPSSDTHFYVNLDPSSSYLWTQINHPINFRRFFQTFARNLKKHLSTSCSDFDSEKLLDDYGLLLFKNYNDDGKSTKDSTKKLSNLSLPTLVDETKRNKSLLISKNKIGLAVRSSQFPDRSSFYIIDSKSEMDAILQELLYKGFMVPISLNVAGTIYNNKNIKISPGEILGVIPNLYNSSNSVMAGVQILATDWDHAKINSESSGQFSPCIFDNTLTVEEGGVTGGSCTETSKDYIRLVKNPQDNKFNLNSAAPVCLALLEEGESSRWVSQDEFRKKSGLSLSDKECLGHSSSTVVDNDFTFNPHECLVRFLPGANDAFFSLIEPQKSFYESVIKKTDSKSFNVGNVLLMEVNKWVPPGTKFRCRLRARFSNCSDCWGESADDYIDAEYNGAKPFKVINFDFDVND